MPPVSWFVTVLLDTHAAPERHVIGDLAGGLARLGVVPGRGWVHVAVDDDVEVARRTLPRTHRRVAAPGEVLQVQRVHREVVIPLDPDCVLGLGEHHALPDGTHRDPSKWLSLACSGERSGRLEAGGSVTSLTVTVSSWGGRGWEERRSTSDQGSGHAELSEGDVHRHRG